MLRVTVYDHTDLACFEPVIWKIPLQEHGGRYFAHGNVLTTPREHVNHSASNGSAPSTVSAFARSRCLARSTSSSASLSS